ncbi:MAG: Protein-export protein SecB [Holosporales bacterium]
MTQENTQQQPVSILGHFLKDISFENPDPIALISQANVAPQVGMDVGVQVNGLNQDHFEVVLKMKLKATQNEKAAFIVELAHSTIVQIDTNNFPKENMNPLLLVHIPHLAFPFVRTIVYNMMREGGLPPFNIAPIDFAAMYEAQQKDENATVN